MEKIYKTLNGLYKELGKTEKMEELEACQYWNCDTKEGAIECLKEEIEFYENELENKRKSMEDEESSDGLDEGFSSWVDVNSMFVKYTVL